MDYVIPKTYFNDTDKSYYASITTCVQLERSANPGMSMYMYMYVHVILCECKDVSMELSFSSHSSSEDGVFICQTH